MNNSIVSPPSESPAWEAFKSHDESIPAAAFGVHPGTDVTPALRTALSWCRNSGIRRLEFAPGTYHFTEALCFEKFLFVSNNDEGLKKVAFPLISFRDFAIEGNGALFLFDGPMVPFLIEESRDIILRNLRIDFLRPFHSEATVLEVTPEWVDVEFTAEFPFEIRNGVLVFTDGKRKASAATTVGNGEVVYPTTSLLAFDPARKETAFMAKDRYGLGTGIPARSLGSGRVRVMLENLSARCGEILVFGSPRHFPGIVISDSQEVHLQDVTLHHAGGMGIVAQRSSDIFLDAVQVTPPPSGRRIVSATADATHFVNCRGKIAMRHCLFEQTKDDATNIHGLYARITRRLGPASFEVRLIHPQQAGIDFLKAGSLLEIVNAPGMETKGTAVVKSVERLNKVCSVIETEQPGMFEVGDVVADAEANTAEVVIRNCVIRGNRARGLLLGSRGRIVVEENMFHTPGSAILFEGDASHWFEQAGVRDVTIRRNFFDACNFGVWGSACIEVRSGIVEDHRPTSRYNKNIVIEENRFRVFGSHPLLKVYSVDGLTFSGNTWERCSDYPADLSDPAPHCEVTHSERVVLEDCVVTTGG